MSECKHEHFFVEADVVRMAAENITPELIVGFAADIKIFCSQCRQPFEFIGIPCGVSGSRPMVGIDATELRVPIKPSMHGKRKEEKNIEAHKN